MNILSNLGTNLLLPGEEELLTPESIKSRIQGSKITVVAELSMTALIWGCKVAMLLIYNKLTFGLKQRWAVKIVAGYVVLGYIIMEILYLGVWCRPFTDYWAVPVRNSKLNAYGVNLCAVC